MRKPHLRKAPVNLHHSIESLGIVHATRGDIRVERLEDRLVPRIPFPHKHDFYHLVLLMNGSGWHRIDFDKHKARRGTLFVMKPGQVHAWKFSAATKGFILEFTRESLPADHLHSPDLISRLDTLPDAMVLKAEDLRKIQGLAQDMAAEFRDRRAAHALILRHSLAIFSVELLRRAPTPWQPQNLTENLVDHFQTLVERHHRRQRSVEFYARELGLTPKALTMRVARARGKSARHLIQERLLLEAKRLLVYSDLNVADIGLELGYEDDNHFVRFFREQIGLTPAKFRQQERKS